VTARWASDGGVGDLSRQLKRLAVPATHDGEKPTGPARDHLASSHGVIQADAFTGYEALVCKSGPPTQIDLSAQTIKIAP
jgi:hypothetical protein